MESAATQNLCWKLIGALIGLARSTEGSEHLITEETNRLVWKSLAAALPQSSSQEETPQDLLARVQAEKDRFAPNCRYCAAPCGRTADFDMESLYHESPEIRDLKLSLLVTLQHMAVAVCRTGDLSADSFPHSVIYKGLYYVGIKDADTDSLHSVLRELNSMTPCYVESETAR